MSSLPHRYITYLSVFLFLVAVLLGVRTVSAAMPNLPAGNPGYGAQNNPGTQYIPSGRVTPAAAGGVQSGTASEAAQTGRMPGFAQQRLAGAKLQACQRIESALTQRSTHLVDLVLEMEKRFTAIAQGVEQYYITQVVPTGTTLPTYNALVADIATKENAITPLVAAAQSDVTNFSCSADNPGASMTQYRTNMQAVITGLQEYRSAIVALITAVRTLPTVSPTGTPSATPTTVTPSVTP